MNHLNYPKMESNQKMNSSNQTKNQIQNYEH
jgi:hypothetical protein